MDETKIKEKVLQQIMDLMDQKESDSLMKHPKLMAAKIEVLPKEDDSEGEHEDPSKEMSMSDFKEDKAEGEDPMADMPKDMSPEDMEKLLSLYHSLK